MLRVSCVSFMCLSEFNTLLTTLNIQGLLKTFLILCISYFPLFFILIRKTNEIPWDALSFIIIVIFLYNITILAHPEYYNTIRGVMWNNVVSLHTGVVFYLIFRTIRKEDDLKFILLTSSLILFLFYFIQSLNAIKSGYWALSTSTGIREIEYSMTFGYKMLLPCLTFFSYGIKEKKKMLLILGVISGGEILMLGSRAATICIAVYFVLYIIFIRAAEMNTKKRIFYIISITVISLIILLYYKQILLSVGNLFDSLGFSSRTINRIIQGNLIEDPIRLSIYGQSVDIIKEHWLFGHGILSDRYYFGVYCHNFFLELFIQFGLIGGCIVLFFLFSKLLKGFNSKHYMAFKQGFIIFFSCSIVRLMVSYSFWEDSNFWSMLAILITLTNMEKRFS